MRLENVIHIFGIDDATVGSEAFSSALKGSVAVVSGIRLYETVENTYQGVSLPKRIPVVPLPACMSTIKEKLIGGDVLVFASGDPLFFGIGRRVVEAFPETTVHIHPAISSMQLAFARFRIPWDDTSFISLHGRRSDNLASRLLRYSKVFLVTDPVNRPDVIAGRLLKKCDVETAATITCHVGECLGLSSEQRVSGTLADIASMQFSEPNVMILLNPEAHSVTRDYPSFGLEEDEICHSRGLLTKNEVRAAALHALRLPRCGVLWDVGAGSGSVGLEAARLFPDSTVLSVEKEEEQWQNIEDNSKKFKAWNINLVKGAAPEALENLPAPDRVFVGGSGGNLQQILEFCAEKLLPEGVIVVNAVIEKTAKIAPDVLSSLGFNVEIREIAVQRYKYPEEKARRFNPIKIIVARKSEE